MEGVDWLPTRDLIDSGGSDPHFVVEVGNDGEAYLRFGNDDLGRAVEPNTTFWARYRVGNGPEGMVGPEAIHTMVTRRVSLSGVKLECRNPFPAAGGVPPESIKDAKLLAPHAFRNNRERAITADDYARLAEYQEPGVQRAAATFRTTGIGTLVQVAVDAKGAVEPSEALLRHVQMKLEQYRRIGHEVIVVPAQYVPLLIDLRVTVRPQYLQGHVKAALLDTLSNRTLADGRLGFFHPDQLSFGQSVYLSRLIRAVKSVEGVESVMVRKLERLFEGARNELKVGVLAIGPLEIARLDNDPSVPEHGMLQLEMQGGR
jgi:predicted phage baseplate assembly protein